MATIDYLATLEQVFRGRSRRSIVVGVLPGQVIVALEGRLPRGHRWLIGEGQPTRRQPDKILPQLRRLLLLLSNGPLA